MISRRDFTAAEQSIDGRTLAGYAAVYGQDSREIVEGGRKFVERIAPGAFNETLSSGADVKLYYNHDASMPLARARVPMSACVCAPPAPSSPMSPSTRSFLPGACASTATAARTDSGLAL